MHILKDLLPPLFFRAAAKMLKHHPANGNVLKGSQLSWRQARDASSGYDQQIILERTRNSLLQVKNRQAVYERDSVLFDEVQLNWPVLAGLMWSAARSEGQLNILDFGGSLGSTYYQNRTFLNRLTQVRWNIVEQPDYVQVGNQDFADNTLRFYRSIHDCLLDTTPNVVLLSSVLQYLEHPFSILDEILQLPVDIVIIDRTPFWSGAEDKVFVQVVPPEIYPASYPSWVFSKSRFDAFLQQAGWEKTAEFDALDHFEAPVKVFHQGAILTRPGSYPPGERVDSQP